MWNVSTFINIGRNPADFVCKNQNLLHINFCYKFFFILYDKIKAIITRGCQVIFLRQPLVFYLIVGMNTMLIVIFFVTAEKAWNINRRL